VRFVPEILSFIVKRHTLKVIWVEHVFKSLDSHHHTS